MSEADASGTPESGITPPGYRLPAGLRLGRIRLQIADLGRSVAFYERVLGFRTIEAHADGVVMGPVDEEVAILELVEFEGARPVPRRGRLGLFHVAYLLPDRADLARFLTHIADEGIPVGTSDHLVSEAIYLSDPDGLGIEVYADRPRSEWSRNGKQIRMLTRPLDVDSLMRTASDTPWLGAPPGTRVGHVHLHVGDMVASERFYHQALGFDKTVWDYPGALFLSAGGYHHHVATNAWAAGAPSPTAEDAQLLQWTILLPESSDAEAAALSMEEHGFSTSRSNGAVTVTDPWGTTVRIATAD